MSRIAFASGFQSLRRFNAVFRERYGMPPTALRRASEPHGPDEGGAELAPGGEMLALTLAYRPPFAWDAALEFLARSATPGVEVVVGRRYGRTVRIGEHSGVVFAEDSPPRREVKIDVSGSLVPVLMPLLAGLRRLFDLDAEPTVIDAHLAEAGLGEQVAGRPGVRVPGALDGFETAMLTLLCGAPAVAGRVVRELGDPIDVGAEGLERITPGPARIAEAGENLLSTLGVSRDRARAIASVARAVVDGSLRLEPDDDVAETLRCLSDVHGVDDSVAVMIAMRALYWPDAFPADDATLMRAAGTATPEALMERAEAWRPWRAYAAMHLWRSKRSSPRNQTIRVPVRATTGRPLAM